MAEPSFRQFLADCRRLVLAEAERDDWKVFDLIVLDRWRDHAFADGAWEAIDKAAMRDGGNSLDRAQFVEWVLQQARLFKRVVDDVIPKSNALEREATLQAEKQWRATRSGVGATSAGMKRDLAQHHRSNRIRVLGRQPNPRKRFILLCRALFLVNCGQPLDDVIDMLVAVVFGNAVGANEVRDALKPTTRRGRDTRPKK